MSPRPEPPASKGMSMIAAYRAERLRQRPALRQSLRSTYDALRQEREEKRHNAAPSAAEAAPQVAAEEPEPCAHMPARTGSIFAGYVSAFTEEARNEPAAPEPPEPLAAENAASPPPPPDSPAPTPPDYDPPLAEIGFGPGMLIRLSQIGLHTMRDLAHADRDELREALGDISRLIDIETWIGSAKSKLQNPTP